MTRKEFMATPIAFLRETRDELKKVVWPTRQEIIRLTAVVIAVSLLVGVFLGGLDFIFTKSIQTIVK
jgi:preprotein translocase subunit SecE